MVLRRVAGYAAIFGLGIGVGFLLLRASIARPVSLKEAQKRAITTLETPAIAMPVGDNKIVTAVRKIEPAVVNIDTVGRMTDDEEGGLPFFAQRGEREVRGKGSGVILTSDGYIVTNNHVIEGAKRIRVTMPEGKWYYANLVGRDPTTDMAVIKVSAVNLPAAELGDSDKLQVGEWSIAVGNPLGLGSTITVGVVSALNRRNLQVGEGKVLDGVIQTDAAINRGNSGGALANINGQLIGINTAILSTSGGSIGLGFAIPSNMVRRITRDLIQTGSVPQRYNTRPYIGVKSGPVPSSVAQLFKLDEGMGVQVVAVEPNSPASRAGIRKDDIVLEVDGKLIGDLGDVREAVMQRKVGEKVVIKVLRPSEQQQREFTVTTEMFPENLLNNP